MQSKSKHIQSPLGNLSPEEFLQVYWQKQPLLIRQAFPEYQSPISPDELAGLACEREIESRIVMERDGPTPWYLRHGPFTETDFQKLPETHWTLLVQECNKYIPELSQLLDRFHFIPRWRLDDVMVSFAPKNGSVGPHVDQYDVFLLQAFGTRRWQISDKTVELENIVPNIELQILKDFSPTDEWVLEPGDILYLPPGLPHYGVALEDCMTISVGFRAPSYVDILANFVDNKIQLLEQNRPEPRYCDPDLHLQSHSGEISQATLNKVVDILRQSLDDTDHIQRWFAQLVTQSTNSNEITEEILQISSIELLSRINNGDDLIRSESSRFAFIYKNAQTCCLFVDGQEFNFNTKQLSAIELLCDQSRYNIKHLLDYLNDPLFIDLIVQLYNSNKLYFENDD